MRLPVLPRRTGPRPATTATNPHRQLDQRPTLATYTGLVERAFALPQVERRPSLVSVAGAQALWLAEQAGTGPREAFLIGREFAHIHPLPDGSLHAALPPFVAADAIQAGWAEVHPVASMDLIPANIVMIYAPRGAAELDVVMEILRASLSYASGRWPRA